MTAHSRGWCFPQNAEFLHEYLPQSPIPPRHSHLFPRAGLVRLLRNFHFWWFITLLIQKTEAPMLCICTIGSCKQTNQKSHGDSAQLKFHSHGYFWSLRSLTLIFNYCYQYIIYKRPTTATFTLFLFMFFYTIILNNDTQENLIWNFR